MIDYLRLRFLRYLGTVGFFLTMVMALLQFITVFKVHAIVDLVLSLSILLSVVCSFVFTEKRFYYYIFPMVALAGYLGTMQFSIEQYGQLRPFSYMIYPIFTMFLVGTTPGFIMSALLFVGIGTTLFLNDFNISLLGISGWNFLLIYLIEVALLYGLERAHMKMLREIETKTYHDDFTGLLNRSGLLQELQKVFKKGSSFYFILTDFDHFSHINANLGHDLSDNIIKEAAGIFKDHHQVTQIGRWYGDQFGILFQGSEDDLMDYLKTRQRLIRTLSDELKVEIEITYSCGITCHPNESITENDLIPYTEIALNEAKKSDRAEYHIFQVDNLEDRNRAIRIERDMLEAVKNEDIEVHFQPKISVQNGRITGMEALIRWNHPELGYIAPPEFVEIAEKNGDIVQLSEYIFHKALTHLKRCHEEVDNTLSVSINISPLHLLHSKFILFLNEAVLEHKVNPENVYLEITENVMLQSDLVKHLEMIQRLGFKLSLDDFGTGYSSLNYLHRFNFDELKIDKSFTDGLLRGDKEIVLFKSILEIASNFKMKTVIEGLEEGKQLDLVRQMSADEIQGWYYSKALPPDEFVKYLRVRNGNNENRDIL